MNYLSQYTIPFSGLKEGKHLFDFSADHRFFAGFEESEIEKWRGWEWLLRPVEAQKVTFFSASWAKYLFPMRTSGVQSTHT